MTKPKIKIAHLAIEFSVVFTLNLIVFSVSLIFTENSFFNCLAYSIINALWMTFLLLPLLNKLANQKRL